MKAKIKNLFQFIRSSVKKKIVFFSVLFFIVFIFSFVYGLKPVLAEWNVTDWASGIAISTIQFIITTLINLFGAVLILVIRVMVFLSLYNSFINNPYVSDGWTMLRDLVNMFFILGLLFIAFVTVLKIEKYSYNRLLAKLLIMAVLVNFSKTIAGVIIDFFQVIMLTFVNAYRDITGGNLFKGLGMTDWFQLNTETAVLPMAEPIDWSNGRTSLAGSIFGLFFVIISIIVIMIFCVILAFRIVALWVLIVFSPLAFLSWTFSEVGGKIGQFANRWMSQFFEYCMVGPLIAFFLWLSVSQMNKMVFASWVASTDTKSIGDLTTVRATYNRMGQMDRFLQYMLAIIMLVAGLKFTGEFKVVGASMAVGAANKIKDQTAGRLERSARTIGQTGWKYTGGMAIGAAKAPFMAMKPIVKGIQEGASERLQRIPRVRLLTEQGRKQAAEEWQARAKAVVPKIGTKERRETRAKHADQYKKLRKDINWDNPDEVKKKFGEEIFDHDKDGNITGKKRGVDNRAIETYFTALADKGKLDYKDLNAMEKVGFTNTKNMDGMERQIFLEDMENRIEKETGRKKALSSLIYNEDTNQYEDTRELEEKGNGVLDKKKASDNLKENLSSKMFTKGEKGEYKLNSTSKEFKDLDPDQRLLLENMESAGIAKDSDFYNVARFADVSDKKKDEVRKKMATANREQYNKAAKQADLGDASVNGKYTGTELDGAVEQLNRVSGMDQAGRENMVAKIGVRFTNNDWEARKKLLLDNKKWFNKDMQQKDGEKEPEYEKRIQAIFKDLDRETGSMGEDQLKKYQDYYVAATGKYDDFGRKQEDGQENDHLTASIKDKRSKEGVKAKIEEAMRKPIKGFSFSADAQDLKTVDSQAAEMLEATKGLDKDKRKEIMSDRLSSVTNLTAGQVDNVVDYIINNEIKIKARNKVVKETNTNVTGTMKNILSEAEKQYKTGTKDTSRIQFSIDSMMAYIDSQIKEGALPDDAFSSKEIKAALAELNSKLGSASDETKFKIAFYKAKRELEAVGYKVSKEKKNTSL